MVIQVREQRKNNKRCKSANEGVDIVQILREIIDSHYFARDYKERTLALLFDDVSYEAAIKSLEKIINSDIFVMNR